MTISSAQALAWRLGRQHLGSGAADALETEAARLGDLLGHPGELRLTTG